MAGRTARRDTGHMSPGALLVFVCAVAGLVLVALAEVWRYWHGTHRSSGRSEHGRLMAELERHKPPRW
jgi:hypothetical protein